MSTHRLHHSTPHGRSRDELGVIADRYTTGPATAAAAAPPRDRPQVPEDRPRKVA